MKKLLLFLLAMTFLASLCRLQAQGTAFTYQGHLQDNGSPANGSYDFRVIVYDNNPGGSQQGPILTNTATAVNDGLFTVTLDFSQVFPGAERWLDISVRTNGSSSFTELSPRQSLTPTPYAITAGAVTSGAGLSGTYGGAVTFNNSADNFTGGFTGNGASVTNVNAAALGGLNQTNFWQLGGNNAASGQFLGSTNNQPVEIHVNNQRVLQLAYASNAFYGYSPNVIGGMGANYVSNGVVGATIAGGGSSFSPFGNFSNVVSADFGTVLGGAGNIASSGFAIAGGNDSIASGVVSVALGNSTASGQFSVALGQATANDTYDTATGGSSAAGFAATALGASIAAGNWATALGSSDASGAQATALGSSSATGVGATAIGDSAADGDYSMAAGKNAVAAYGGDFVWADNSNPTNQFTSTGSNQFLIRAVGGVILDGASQTDLNFGSATRQMINLFGTSYGAGVQNNTLYQRSNSRFSWYKGGVHSDTEDSPGAGGSILMTLTSGGLTVNNTLASTSDRNAKQDFAPVNPREVLDKVAALPITKWIYKTDTGTRHIGPMAQDFYAAFAVGPDDKHITTVDEGGVALAAIQGLNQKLNEKDAEIEKLKRQNDSLAERLNGLEASVKQLAAQR